MKIRYYAALAVVSLLSVGAIAGCGSSDPAQISSSTDTEVQANPCASKANPCAAKANPCASKANPCAAKADSVGGALAQELQGKPVVVDVFATWCSACQNIAPTVSQLKEDYEGKVHFVVLDMSNQSTTAEAETKAEKLGLSKFLEANKSQTGLLAIIDPATGKILAQHRNNATLSDYTTVLDTALTQ